MSLAEQIDALPATSERCRTCRWYEQQDEATQAAINRYIDRQDPKNGVYKPLYDLCAQNGLDVASKTFRDHIREHHRRQVAA